MPGRGTSVRAGVAVGTVLALLLAATAGGASRTRSPVLDEYAQAARASGVPAPLLAAIGYVNARWRMPTGRSPDGGVGPMHLRPAALRSAARLTGIAPQRLARVRALNIRGGAALLRRLAHGRPDRLEGWSRAVERLGGAVFADQVYAVLARGAAARVGGVTVTLAPQHVRTRLLSAATAGRAEYPAALWRPASAANFTRANRPASRPITRIVIHLAQGSYGGTINWFRNPAARASAHFVVRSSDGQVTQMIAEHDIAWHAGNSAYNATSIGIEHEGYVSNCGWFTDALYRGSARLVAYLALKYAIPIDRAHVIGHNEVPDPGNPRLRGGFDHHTDPGPCWDWTKYLALVREYAGRSDEAVVDDAARARFTAPGWRRTTQSPQRYGRSYAVARPSATARPATFRVRVPVAGDYALYGWWPAYRNRNAAVPVDVETASGPQRILVDQRANGRRWVLLGTFAFRAGNRLIRISRATSTPGWISADAVKLEPVRPVAASSLDPDGAGWALTARALSATGDAGATWRAIGPPAVPAGAIRAVDFLRPGHGWVAALPGPAAGLQLLGTADGGTTWTPTTLPAPADLDASAPVTVEFPDELNGFVALRREDRGEGAGVLLRTADGGATWRSLSLPVSGVVRFATARDGWLSSPETGGLYVTRNAGASWRLVQLPRPAAYRGSILVAGLPSFTDPLTGILPVTLAGKRSAVAFLASRDGGRTWRLATTIPTARPLTRARLLPSTVVDSGTWLAALEGGRRLVVVGDAGARQIPVVPRSLPFGGTRPPVAALRFSTTATGWAQVDSLCPVFHGPRCTGTQALYGTTDGGASWRRLTPP